MKRLLLAVMLLSGCDEILREDKEDPAVAECERLGAEFDAALDACVQCAEKREDGAKGCPVCQELPEKNRRRLDYCLSEYRKARDAATR